MINFNLNGPVFSDDVIDPFIIGDADSDTRFKELGLFADFTNPNVSPSDSSASPESNALHLFVSSRAWAFDKRGNLIDTRFDFLASYYELINEIKDKSAAPRRSSRDPSPIPHYFVLFTEAQLQALLTHYGARLVNYRGGGEPTGDRTKHYHDTENPFEHTIEFPNGDLPTNLRVIASATDPVDGTTRPRLYISENEEIGEINRRVRIIRNVEGREPITSASIAAILICCQIVLTHNSRWTKSQNSLLGTLFSGIVKQHNDNTNKIVSRVNESLQGSGSLPIRSDDLAIDFGATTSSPYAFPQREGGKHLENLYKGEVELRRLVSSFNLDALHTILTEIGDDTPTAKEIRQSWISLTDSYEARQAEADAIIVEPGEGLEPEAPEPDSEPEPDTTPEVEEEVEGDTTTPL